MPKFVLAGFLISLLVFVSRDFELGRKLRCDLRKNFSSDLRLARRRSRPSINRPAFLELLQFQLMFAKKVYMLS